MNLKELTHGAVAAMVEYYDDSDASKKADRLVEDVKAQMGPDAPVYRVDITGNNRERAAVHITNAPVIIIYRDGREEWRFDGDFPDAATLASRLRESMQAPGAVNPLKGHHRI